MVTTGRRVQPDLLTLPGCLPARSQRPRIAQKAMKPEENEHRVAGFLGFVGFLKEFFRDEVDQRSGAER